ncbi:MAG TPA: PAS domain-containing sensor histidine kinase [Ktedonobacteraceae bacterium]|nr:PAS domain-containing sensor histidine kinase [Ktedonobacteraceae bacterium]
MSRRPLKQTQVHEEPPPLTPTKGAPTFLEAIVSHTSDAMIALDEHFHILDLNAAAIATLGRSSDKAIGRSCTEVLHCRNLNRMELCGTSSCPLVRVLHRQQPLPNEELLIGDACEVSASVTPVEVGNNELHVIFTARDMSALKVANRVRANFVSMVSHELRTPLNSVHGFIDLLLQGHMGEMTAEQQKYLGYAGEGVQQLISIVEDILFMSRSDVGQFEIKQEKVNLRVLARQVVSSLEPQAHKSSVFLNKDIPSPTPLLYVDPQRMKQVLNNLVTNAIKFTPPEGTVTIRASYYDEQFTMISVADTGYGIPAEDRQHVFERFYQSNHMQQSKMGGYGLGLSIARLIVEQHGGTIGFDSSTNRGTTFYFTAPLYTGQSE